MLSDYLAVSFAGLATGSVYALLGSSYNVAAASTGVLSFAQGDLAMVAGLVAALVTIGGAASWVFALGAALLVGAVLSVVIAVVAVLPILQGSVRTDLWIISTLGASLVIEGIANNFWGPVPKPVNAPPAISQTAHNVAGVLISPYMVVCVVLGVAITTGLAQFYRSWPGRRLRAAEEDWDLAQAHGMRMRTQALTVFAVSGAIAGLAGYLFAWQALASPGAGVTLLLGGFEAAAIGGIGRNMGTLLAGWLLGLVSEFGAVAFSPAYSEIATFVTLLVVLLIRPAGLLGYRRGRTI
jgi:branched-chain amino acid transport system permease protein